MGTLTLGGATTPPTRLVACCGEAGQCLHVEQTWAAALAVHQPAALGSSLGSPPTSSPPHLGHLRTWGECHNPFPLSLLLVVVRQGSACMWVATKGGQARWGTWVAARCAATPCNLHGWGGMGVCMWGATMPGACPPPFLGTCPCTTLTWAPLEGGGAWQQGAEPLYTTAVWLVGGGGEA